MLIRSCFFILHTWWWLTFTPWFLKEVTHEACLTAISIVCARAWWFIGVMLSFSALSSWLATSDNFDTTISTSDLLSVANVLRRRTWLCRHLYPLIMKLIGYALFYVLTLMPEKWSWISFCISECYFKNLLMRSSKYYREEGFPISGASTLQYKVLFPSAFRAIKVRACTYIFGTAIKPSSL